MYSAMTGSKPTSSHVTSACWYTDCSRKSSTKSIPAVRSSRHWGVCRWHCWAKKAATSLHTKGRNWLINSTASLDSEQTLNSYQNQRCEALSDRRNRKRAHRQKNSTYRCKTQKLAILVIPRDSKLFWIIKCQRWDYIIIFPWMRWFKRCGHRMVREPSAVFSDGLLPDSFQSQPFQCLKSQSEHSSLFSARRFPGVWHFFSNCINQTYWNNTACGEFFCQILWFC